LSSLVVLDVGHANCAVITAGGRVSVVDAGAGNDLLEYLEETGCRTVHDVLISHADADHLGGASSLLLHGSISVERVFLNPDVMRGTATWEDFRVALRVARAQHGTEVHTQLTSTCNTQLDFGDVRFEVLHPRPEVAASGAGGHDLKGRRITANGMSAAVRVWVDGRPEALLAGDIDATGLENLLEETPDPHARILVFPHHGGAPGTGNPYAFASRLCLAVKPEIVLFSIGRGRNGTPRPEIVAAIRHTTPGAHIACTQLSEHCSAVVPVSASAHLSRLPARGKRSNASCIGTIEFSYQSSQLQATPTLVAHRDFVQTAVSSALCLGGQAPPP
jgi:beta-lactamase superfamily II metal-dependent hydrolase